MKDYKPIASIIRDKRLSIFNVFGRPLIRATNRYKEIHNHISKRPDSPIEVRDDIYEGVFAVSIKEPTGRRAVWVFYVSVQEWYLTPNKIPSKVRKVLVALRQLSTPDTYAYVAIVAKRATSGAHRLASSMGVPIRTLNQVIRDIKKFLLKRYTQLIAALRGKRVYGELAALLYLLQEVLKEFLGVGVPTVFNDPFDAIICYERGCTVPSGLDPPKVLDDGW